MSGTKEKLIDVATELFSENGYKETTVAEICSKADANVAAVNYHFGDKEHLYVEVWARALKAAAEKFPFDGGLPEEAPAQDHLRAHIGSIIMTAFSDGAENVLPKLRSMETAKPTGLMKRVIKRMNRDVGRHMESTVARIAGPIDNISLHLCITSILSQCFNFSTIVKNSGNPLMKACGGSIEPETVIEHILNFSLAGIKSRC